MSTPRGGQYQLKLPDGSKVWLNAASSITYPTAFTGDNREVKITGEAYFDVVKNESKPFVVKTYKDRVIVLGTEFNINSYTDEGFIKTSLVEGTVKINQTLLKPGQAYINGKILETDLSKDLAWKNGLFSFENADIQSVMRQLARWYDVEVKFKGSISTDQFSGKLGRNLALSQVMRLLRVARVNYEIEK